MCGFRVEGLGSLGQRGSSVRSPATIQAQVAFVPPATAASAPLTQLGGAQE